MSATSPSLSSSPSPSPAPEPSRSNDPYIWLISHMQPPYATGKGFEQRLKTTMDDWKEERPNYRPLPNGEKFPTGELKPVGCPFTHQLCKYGTLVKVRSVLGHIDERRRPRPDESGWINAKFQGIHSIFLRDYLPEHISPEQQIAEMVVVEYSNPAPGGEKQGYYFPCFGEVWFDVPDLVNEPKITWGPSFNKWNLMYDYIRSMIVFIPTIAHVRAYRRTNKPEMLDIFWLPGYKTTPWQDKGESEARPGSVRWTVTPLRYLGGIDCDLPGSSSKAGLSEVQQAPVQAYISWTQFRDLHYGGNRPWSIFNRREFSVASPAFVQASATDAEIYAELQSTLNIDMLRRAGICLDCRFHLPWFFKSSRRDGHTRVEPRRRMFLDWFEHSDAAAALAHRCTLVGPDFAAGQRELGPSYNGYGANYVDNLEQYCAKPNPKPPKPKRTRGTR